MDDEALLVSETYKQNEIGVMESVRVVRAVWVTVQSVSRTEFYRAGLAGLQPTLMLTTPAINYDGEGEVIYHGKHYAVYRTYQPPESDEMELYLTPKAGLTHGEQMQT